MYVCHKANKRSIYLSIYQSGKLGVFCRFLLEVPISLKPIPYNLFLRQSYIKNLPPVKYPQSNKLDRKCKNIIFDQGKNKKIPQVPSSSFYCSNAEVKF